MVFLVLGFQKINPFCPKVLFKFFCFFFIVISVLGEVFALFSDTILSLIQSKNTIIGIAATPAPLGILYACIFWYRKTFGRPNELKREEQPAQKKSAVKYAVRIAIAFVFAFILFSFISTAFRTSEPYMHSMQLIERNAKVQEYLGENYKQPFFISGSMSTSANGTGKAALSYRLKGKNGSSRVYVEAQKENDSWIYKKIIFYKAKGNSDCVDLLLQDNGE